MAARNDLRKASERSELELLVGFGDDEPTQEASLSYLLPDRTESVPLFTYIHNRGNAFAIWWYVVFRVPEVLYIGPSYKLDLVWGKITESGEVSVKQKDGYIACTFRSNGQKASYPKQIDVFARFVVQAGPKSSEAGPKYKIPYTIFSDRGPKQAGEVAIRLLHISSIQ
jgi:hypothetical protein